MEKKRSKGSFFSLFDWNSKSRKKLLWNNDTLPEASKHGKENVESVPKTQINRIKVDENGASPSNIANSDFSCALSISSDEGCKAPGLVARLMGLDTLPTSAVTELSSTSLYRSNSHETSHCRDDALYSKDDFGQVDYLSVPLKMEKSSWDAMDSRAHNVGNWPIKRFQTEMLPPKSAKPIPVTHNKLLSPIKSPGFTSPKNAAHIMEAAAKIIEGSPRPYMRNKTSTVRPSSVPLRILDLKERLESSQYASVPEKLVDRSTSNLANGKTSERSNNLYKSSSAFKGSRDSEKTNSRSIASKGKSVSQAIQGQTNVQSIETLTSNGNKYMKQKEQTEIRSNRLSRNQKPSTHRASQQRTGTSRNINVLGQNNLKQNSLTNKAKSTSKVDSNKVSTRNSSSESSTRVRRTTNKGVNNANIQPARSNTRATGCQKEFLRSETESISQRKKYVSRDVHEARGPDKAVNNFENKSIKCNVTTDCSTDPDAFNMKESNDVISFTFTSPLRRSIHESLSSTEQVVGSRNRIVVDSLGHSDNLYPKKLLLSPPGLHMIDGDTLSDLLEKKLQELTSRINLPQCTMATEESSADSSSSLQNNVPSLVCAASGEQDRSFHPYLFRDKLDSVHGYRSSNDDQVLSMNQQLQISAVLEDPSCSSCSENGNYLGCRHPGAETFIESPSVSQSYLDSEDSAYGSTIYSSMQDEEVSNFSEINESLSLENEVSPGQSSSASTIGKMAAKQSCEISKFSDFKRSRNTGLEYVQDILANTKFMIEEFATGQTNRVIMPNAFDQLENQSNGTENCEEECSKLERKVVFDFVSECLEFRCRQAFVGNCKQWHDLVTSIQRKSCLAEELYKQMLGFRNMEEEVMVDELVSNDMGTGRGRWLDFSVEAFEEGLEVEQDILDDLINEVVSDLLFA